ncbi:hypothetical protein SCUP234_07398 [Seiridium cupressi]
MQFTIIAGIAALFATAAAAPQPALARDTMDKRLYCDDYCGASKANPILYGRCFQACLATVLQDGSQDE